MLTLYSYPDLFGAADNDPFGLKVFAFMRLCGLAFEHRHDPDQPSVPATADGRERRIPTATILLR